MQRMPLPEIARVVRQMCLAIQALAVEGELAHPADLGTGRIRNFEIGAFLAELLGDGVDVDGEEGAQELADLGVLVVAGEGGSGARVRGVDVDVGGGVAVGGPAGLGAPREHVGVGVECGLGRVGDGFDFFFRVVVDAEAGGDAVDDEDLLLLVRGRGEEVGCVFDGETLGGVRGVGEGRGVPYVVWVGGVEFWKVLV